MDTATLRTATPQEVDAYLVEQMIARAAAVATVTSLEKLSSRNERQARELAGAIARREAAFTECRAIDEAYRARGGWSRFLIVPDGHIHRGHGCSTLYPTTERRFVPQFSGMSDDQLIAATGCTACTICFPDAPSTATWAEAIRRTDAEKVAARDARKAGAREKLARKVTNAETRLTRAQAKLAKVAAKLGITDPATVTPEQRQAIDPAGELFYATSDVDYAREDVERAARELSRWDRTNPGYASAA